MLCVSSDYSSQEAYLHPCYHCSRLGGNDLLNVSLTCFISIVIMMKFRSYESIASLVDCAAKTDIAETQNDFTVLFKLIEKL